MNGFNDLILWLATSGYIFVESDYLGLGVSNMLHPYHLKDVTATTVIDMLRATKHFLSLLCLFTLILIFEKNSKSGNHFG